MRACTFISNRTVLLFSILFALGAPRFAFAADERRPESPEAEDFSETPYTEYGNFDEDEEEDQAVYFYQHGRFFGVSAGVGYEGVTGNRGMVWRGGIPVIDLKVHYWFDFNFALNLGLSFMNHDYDYRGTRNKVGITRLGMDLRYYFDVRNATAAVTFLHPFLVGGIGAYQKSESDANTDSPDRDNAFGTSLGAGLEFVLSPKKTYLTLEGKAHFVSYKDEGTTRFQPEIEDLTGFFYTGVMSLMFTW